MTRAAPGSQRSAAEPPSTGAGNLASNVTATNVFAADSTNGSNVGPIIGGAAGGLIALAVLALLAALLVVRARRRRQARLKAPAADPLDADSSHHGGKHGHAAGAAPVHMPAAGQSHVGPQSGRTMQKHGASHKQAVDGSSPSLLSHTVRSGGGGSGSGRGPEQQSLAAISTIGSGGEMRSTRSNASRASPLTLPSPMSVTQKRIMPAAGSAYSGAAITRFSGAVVVQPSTLDEPGQMDRLVTGLENMATSEPAELFAGRYRLKAEWVRGGQALVIFARDDSKGFFQYAIKCARVSPCADASCAAVSRSLRGRMIRCGKRRRIRMHYVHLRCKSAKPR